MEDRKNIIRYTLYKYKRHLDLIEDSRRYYFSSKYQKLFLGHITFILHYIAGSARLISNADRQNIISIISIKSWLPDVKGIVF